MSSSPCSCGEPGANAAELFALAEWQRWRGEHAHAPFADWLAEQLTVAHPTVPAAVARELVDARLILPVLDGLDEIATVEHRRACIAAIDAYTVAPPAAASGVRARGLMWVVRRGRRQTLT